MTRRRTASPLVTQAQRDAYLASRYLAAAKAAQQGRLPQYLVKKAYHRQLIRWAKRLGIW